jgi:DNA-binding transcriptional MerR regulator
MAGSYRHCRNEDGSLRLDLIENLRDAGGAIEEMFDMIEYLSGGDKRKIHEAWRSGHYKKRMPERVKEEPSMFAYDSFWED